MVHRIYVEKRPGLSPEAGNLLADLRDFLGIRSLAGVRVLNRYDVENIDPQVYERAKTVVFSEPQADVIWDETFPQPRNAHSLLAVEALPGQFDQRADSCAQCIQLMAGVERPRVRHAKVYLLEGRLSQEELDKIRGYLINPVESREAALEKALDTMRRAVEALDEAGYGDMTLCPETMGKIGQLGTLEEVLALCGVDKRITPCIDFGHLNARTLGGIQTKADYAAILDRMGEALGDERASRFHVHFSRIEFSEGGEKRHWTFAETQYGPEPAPLMELLAERRLAPTIICESAGTQAEDARTMAEIWRAALQNGG